MGGGENHQAYLMSTYELRKKLVTIASRDVGQLET